MIHLKNSVVYELSKNTEEWEPFIVEGNEIGQVSWLRQTQDENGVLAAGLWRHLPEEHPVGMPYGVAGNETFYVVSGEAEVVTDKGEKVELKEGNSYSFTDGFAGTWTTKKAFVKFFIVS
ncbi:cupin domain-containing protein [Halobacillus sp. Marseille-P3879]|uniref:cupin domain-containing protein n=1 Tax=Halobacillus sp. Marseille-P3879 TaxID=2045014 RepID=UPI000C7C2128|nr:cupin domain-containing protein [Halobacillus sp. Marseille-P3879]